jgi:hypothetical protein
MEVLRYKRVSHATYLPDLVLAEVYLFRTIKEGLQIMQASSEEEIGEAVIDILRRMPTQNRKMLLPLGASM